MRILTGRDWPAYPQPRILITLNSWYGAVFSLGFLILIFWCKTYSYFRVFLAENQRFDIPHRDPGSNRCGRGRGLARRTGGHSAHAAPADGVRHCASCGRRRARSDDGEAGGRSEHSGGVVTAGGNLRACGRRWQHVLSCDPH